MKKFEGILLLTDLDGTLLRHDTSVSEETRRAIAYFMREGGSFSLVSGRSPIAMEALCRELSPNAPVGCFNGCGIFDPLTFRVGNTVTVPPEVLEMVAFVDKTLPEVGIEIFTPDKIYFCKQNFYTEKHRTDENLPMRVIDYAELCEPILKILFATDAETVIRLAAALAAHPLAKKFCLMQSDPNYYEILPLGVDKSRCVKSIVSAMPCIHTVVSAGDNDNDVPMLAASDISFAVENASPAAKRAATYTTVSNQDHAIARIVAWIEENLPSLKKGE